MKVTLTVEVVLERTQGKFAPKEEVAEALAEEIDNADPGSICGVGADGDSDYEITEWEVQFS